MDSKWFFIGGFLLMIFLWYDFYFLFPEREKIVTRIYENGEKIYDVDFLRSLEPLSI